MTNASPERSRRDQLLTRVVRHAVFISPFFFPLYLLRFSVAGVPLTVLEVFCYALFALWLLDVIIDRRRLPWDRPHAWFWGAAMAIAVGAAAGMVFAPTHVALPSGELLNATRLMLGVWKGWVVAPILVFAVLTETLKSPDDVKKILKMFVWSAVAVSLVCYGWALFADGVTVDFRLRGFFESANYLSLYLVPAILISIGFMMQRTAAVKKEDLLNTAALVTMVHALFFTQSYAAVLAVFGAVILFVLRLLLKYGKALRKAAVALALLVLVLIVVVATQLNSPKFKQFLDFKNRSSTTVRLEVYTIALDLIKTHPVMGIGPGMFQAEYQTKGPVILGHAPMEWNIPHPHNVFLAFWLNAGLLGLMAFFLILILAHRRFTYPLLALWGIVLHGLFDMPFWKNDLAMIFWLVIACILILQTHGTDSPKNIPARAR